MTTRALIFTGHADISINDFAVESMDKVANWRRQLTARAYGPMEGDGLQQMLWKMYMQV